MSNEIFYVYHKKVVSKEHMLLANEIAKMYGIVTSSGNYAVNFVSAYLQQIAQVNKHEQLFYLTRHGESKVYPYSLYNENMINLRKALDVEKLRPVTIKNKTYNVKKLGEY